MFDRLSERSQNEKLRQPSVSGEKPADREWHRRDGVGAQQDAKPPQRHLRWHLKSHANILQVFASLRCKSLVPEQPHRIAVYLNGRRLLEDDDTNPDGEQPGLSLYLISENDGQRALRSITEALTERVKHGDMTIDDISVDLVAEQLHLLVMPAPDLIVVFGSELNLSGYPLWHLQQAELETLYNEDEFGFLAFAHALQSYAGAEMRYGK
ncbi:hypothetical protein NHJ6243_000066 [Beauveria neobassiana]